MNQQQQQYYPTNSQNGTHTQQSNTQQQTIHQQHFSTQSHNGVATRGSVAGTPTTNSGTGSANRATVRSVDSVNGLQILHPGPGRVQQQLQLQEPLILHQPSPPCVIIPVHQQQHQPGFSALQDSVSPVSSQMSHSSVFPAPQQQQGPLGLVSESFLVSTETPTGSFYHGQQQGLDSSLGSVQQASGSTGLYSNPLHSGSGSNLRGSTQGLPNIISPANSVTSWGSTPMGFSSTSCAPTAGAVNYGHPNFGSNTVFGYRGPNPQTPVELPTHASVYETKVRMMCNDAAAIVARNLTLDYAPVPNGMNGIITNLSPPACVVLNTSSPSTLARKAVSPKNIIKGSANKTSDSNLKRAASSSLSNSAVMTSSLLLNGGSTSSSNGTDNQDDSQASYQASLEENKKKAPPGDTRSPPSTQDLIREERELLDGFQSKSWGCFVAPSSSAATAISLAHYMERLIMQMYSSETCLLLAIVLMRRYCEKVSDFPLTTRTVHRLLLACYVLAAKNHEEKYYGLSYYAKVGGLAVDDLREMELQAFIGVGFNCFVEAEDYRGALLEMQAQRESIDSLTTPNGGTDMSSIGGGGEDFAGTMSTGSESDLCTPGILPLPHFLLAPQPLQQSPQPGEMASSTGSSIHCPPLLCGPPSAIQLPVGDSSQSSLPISHVPRSAFWDDLLPAMV